MLESKKENIVVGESIEAEEKMFIDKPSEILGDHLEAVLESWCNIDDAKFFYIRKAGNHLEVGKAEIHCIQ